MPIRKSKPTSPGRRFATFQLREELTADRAAQAADRGQAASPAGATRTAAITSRHRGGGAKRRYRRIDFKRRKDGVPAKVATIEYDPNRTCYIALLHYADGAQELHPRPAGPAARRSGRVRRARRHPARATRCRCARSRPGRSSTTSSWSPARAAAWAAPPAPAIQVAAKEGADGHPAPALVGDADGARGLPRHRRRALQRRAPEREARQGGPRAPQGTPPADPRRGDEPGRPPARRRRGPPHARRPSRDAVGQADARATAPARRASAPTR